MNNKNILCNATIFVKKCDMPNQGAIKKTEDQPDNFKSSQIDFVLIYQIRYNEKSIPI